MRTTTEAQRRAHILTFWKKYGFEAARDAFGCSRSTLFVWQKRLRYGNGRLAALESRSRRPRHCRGMTTPSYVIQHICALRSSFPHYGKRKLQIILREEEHIVVSASTIAKVIERYHLPSAPRLYVARQRRRQKKNRKPHDFAAEAPGDLVSMDTIEIQEHGRKKYIITALDHATRIAMARTYERHTSRQARDLLQRMQLALGVSIRHMLTDNGSEFMAAYDKACQEMGIARFWTYPRTPKMNAHSERFNRTIQEEARFPPFSASMDIWNIWIGHYIMQYNCHRPHQALAYKRPLDQYCSCLSKTSEESRMWATHTDGRLISFFLVQCQCNFTSIPTNHHGIRRNGHR